MKYLEDMIKLHGEVKKGNILKVDSILNHRIDPDLYAKIGEEFFRLFKDKEISLILTVEASGIGIAAVTAQYFMVPAIFAKKAKTANIGEDLYTARVKSFTHNNEYTMSVSKKYINETDIVLIVDDFLAEGQAVLGLKSIIDQAGAKLAGCGIVIEKGFSKGGSLIRGMGIRVEPLALIKSMDETGIQF